MSAISARVLDLLALLQARRHWTGEDLARRLEVSPRTLRRDVESLQGLGYPITTTRGTGGGYQLSPGGALPPLVLTEDEAASVVVALKEAATGSHPTEAAAAVSALAKIVQVLPSRIRRRIDSLQRLVTTPGPFGGAPAAVDTATLTTCALAARDHEGMTFSYTDAEGSTTHRHVDPHHVVSLDQRLYLVAYDRDRADWRSFRIDRVVDPERTRRTFAPRRLPVADPAELVRMHVATARTRYDVTAGVQMPAAAAQRMLGEWGTATPVAEHACTVHIPAGDVDWAAFALVGLGAPFVVHGPEDVAARLAEWGARLTAAAGAPAQRVYRSRTTPPSNER